MQPPPEVVALACGACPLRNLAVPARQHGVNEDATSSGGSRPRAGTAPRVASPYRLVNTGLTKMQPPPEVAALACGV